ncbi:ATP-binding protein [Phenylobacterium sp.]|uniref:ATP-binding protein n=1 Tax=Phenylobacterium sp. TaxID=1871053 RepID=UPI00272F7245|nr:ATP-binding protein [Phenylobacterium sp.]MDP1875124.1 ATP-binding protein [Phenylobacterium sp.]
MPNLTTPNPDDIKVEPAVLAESQTPILRMCAAFAAIYYLVITLSHPFFEVGPPLWVLTGLSATTTVSAFFVWRRLRDPMSLPRLEAAAVLLYGLFLTNVTVQLSFHFEPLKLIYYVLLALAFATSAPTRRVGYSAALVSLAGLVLMARGGPGNLIDEYVYVGFASLFAAIGISSLMREAVMREIRARLATDRLNRALRHELARNQDLAREAQGLAVAARAADRAKSEFLTTMSHEIRTPLNGVLGMVQVMERDDLAPTQRERLATVRGSAVDLLDILNAILDVSRIEAGEMSLHVAPFDLDRFADTLRKLYGQLAADRGLGFRLDVSSAASGQRVGDEVRVRQILSNLISNALKFTEAGSVVVRIGGDDQRLICEVQDTGMGIPHEHQARIFEKFVQADSSNTRRSGGTGLGLAICRELAELMGGKITFASQPGLGSRFTLELPLCAVESRAEAPLDKPQVKTQPGLAPKPALNGLVGRRILIADDNLANRAVLQTLLEGEGAECGLAADGLEALDAWESGRWHVILMDIHMPRLDGLAAARQIRALERSAGRHRTPVIAVTASVMAEEIRRYTGAGIDLVAAKPIQFETLLSQIEQVVAANSTALPSLAEAPEVRAI